MGEQSVGDELKPIVTASFTGGEKLASHLAKMERALGSGGEVHAGFLEGATYPLTPTKALRKAYGMSRTGKVRRLKTMKAVKGALGATNVATVAAMNEFGKENQPPRPFFRRMIKKESPTWGRKVSALLKRFDFNTARVLDALGQDLKGALQQSINELVSPPLKASTIKAKGFAKPLISSGTMIHSVDYEVKI